MAFSVHVLTNNGVSLIARATAANKIIYTRVVTSSSAMTAEAAAASSPSSFSGPEGQIVAASAVDSLARIVGKVANASSSQIELRSFGLCARLEGDSTDVVVCVLSDESAAIILPPAGGVPVSASVPFPLNISGGSAVMVEVTTTGSATLADLERFVSIHTAGNPSAGDNQIIRGRKTFYDDTLFDCPTQFEGNVAITGSLTFDDATGNKLKVLNELAVSKDLDGTLDCLMTAGESAGVKSAAISVKENATERAAVTIGATSGYSFASVAANGTSEYCTLRLQSNIGAGAAGGSFSLLADGIHGISYSYLSLVSQYLCTLEADKIVLSAGLSNRLVIEDDGSGYSIACKAKLSVESGCTGLAPSGESADTSVTVPVGGIVSIWMPNTGTGSIIGIDAGVDVVTVSASQYKTAKNSNGTWTAGERYVPAGKYVAVMDVLHTGGNAWGLFIRVE